MSYSVKQHDIKYDRGAKDGGRHNFMSYSVKQHDIKYDRGAKDGGHARCFII
jgi:hypothetical protein